MQLEAKRRCILRSKNKGEVEFSSIEIEKPTYGNEVTTHAVEASIDIADHVRPNADEYSIQGVLVGTDAPDKLAKLLQFRKEGLILDYIGRNGIYGVVIKGISTEHHVRIRNGLYFTMTLVQVRTAGSIAMQIRLPSAKPITNVGVKQPEGEVEAKPEIYIIRSGDTLTALAKRFNTTIEAIMAINPQIKNRDLIYAGASLNIPK